MAGTKSNVSARETAYQLIRSRIINLDLKPNDVLNEKELVEEMGMSRTPIHEAIIMLSLEHLVPAEQHLCGPHRPENGGHRAV